jgi:hypothetical protein
MSSTPLPPEKRAKFEDLARAIREAIDAEISELAANLATTDDAHIFGDNEFKVRDIAHKIAAKAIEQRLAQKKRIRGSQRDLSALRPSSCVPFAPPAHVHKSYGLGSLLPRLLSLPAMRQRPVPV